MKRGEMLDALDVARTVVDVLAEKKGEDILLLDIKEKAFFTDYFVICSATSERMLRALAESLKEKVHEAFRIPTRIEGGARDGWILMDLGDVVVHLFSIDQRMYYALEELWAEGKVLLHLQ
jgi:ribosome-associated protein